MFSCQKHFSKVNPVQNDNNNNKIVVKKFKRASSSASNLSGNEEGAMTLEASLIVPIFLIVLLMEENMYRYTLQKIWLDTNLESL